MRVIHAWEGWMFGFVAQPQRNCMSWIGTVDAVHVCVEEYSHSFCSIHAYLYLFSFVFDCAWPLQRCIKVDQHGDLMLTHGGEESEIGLKRRVMQLWVQVMVREMERNLKPRVVAMLQVERVEVVVGWIELAER